MQNFSADDLHRATVYDRDGQKVGRVQQVYLDDDSGRPSWVTVNTGLFGTNESLIPVGDARINDDVLQVPFDKSVIKDAPNFDPGHHLDERDEDRLYDYYGIGHAGGQREGEYRDDDGTRADRVMGRTDEDTDRHRADRGLTDRDPGHRDAPGGRRAAGVGGVAAAAGARSADTHGGDQRQRDQRTDPAQQADPVHFDDRDRQSGEGSRLGDPAQQAGDPVQFDDRDRQSDTRDHLGDRERQSDTRDHLGDRDRQGLDDSQTRDDDPERSLLDRERDLLQRERELLDRDRQFLEREQERSGRPRLRRHDGGGPTR